MIFYNITGNTSEYMKRIISGNTIFIIFTHFMSDIYQVIVERDNLAPNYRSKLKTAIPNKKQLSFTTYKPRLIFGRIRVLKRLWSQKFFDCSTFQFLSFFSLFCLFVCTSLLWKLFCFFRQLFLEYVLRHILEGPVFSQCLFTRHLYTHDAPYLPPKVLDNLCVLFLLSVTAVPREIENNAYAKFWGANKVHYGRCPSGVYEVRRPTPCFLVKFRCVCRGRRVGVVCLDPGCSSRDLGKQDSTRPSLYKHNETQRKL